MQMRFIAPAGAPIRAADLARAAGLMVARRDPSAALCRLFRERFGVRHAFVASTGRAGLTIVLRALRRHAAGERAEVVLPAYTCYSVAASVVKAGLTPRLVDIVPERLDYDEGALRAVDFSRVLAVVATNLYGLPNNLPALRAITRERGVYLVDDAAQAMGASVGGQLCGTWGDAGLFSLDKGKNVSAIDGGVIVSNDDAVGAAIREEIAALPAPPLSDAVMGAAKAMVYFAMLRPWLYWIPNRLPLLGLGQTVFTTEFPLARPSRPLAALGVAVAGRLDALTRGRVANAALLLDRLQRVPGVRTIEPLDGATPVYLRLPILMPDESARRRALDALAASGIGASGSYPESLADVPELQPFLPRGPVRASGARHVARRIVTLPTHAFVTRQDVADTIEAVAGAVHGAAAGAAGAVLVR